jgi:hypothetical protein
MALGHRAKPLSWLSPGDQQWSKKDCQAPSLTNLPLIGVQCKLILLDVIDLVILR